MLMVHDMMAVIKYSACSIMKVLGFNRERKKDRRTKSPSMSFNREVSDIGLERCRAGHSCVPKPD